jgi:D-alanyl-lipoteichoic acid acyltransferase DltB (MBOAT superfamily)
MSFDSLNFVVFSLAAMVLLRVARTGLARGISLLALNLAFVGTFFNSPAQAIPIACFAIAGYAAVLMAERVGRRTTLGLAILLALGFAWLRRYTFLSFLPQPGFPYVTVGLSYILFRILHLVVDTGQGSRKAPGPLTYFNYLFFFASFVSGPIQRSESFERQTREFHPLRDVRELADTLHRIILGLFMMALLTPQTAYYNSQLSASLIHRLATNPVSSNAVLLVAATSLVFIVHLYIGFQGYMHLVIGLARLCGIGLPENFDRPWLAGSFLELWTRWHITLSEWFKFYVFNPLLRALAERYVSPAALTWSASVAFFVTFLIMGIWHGSSVIYVVYGLLLGFGVVVNRFITHSLTGKLGKKNYKALAQRPWFIHLGRAAGLSYFTICVACLWLTPEHTRFISPYVALVTGGGAYLFLTFLVFFGGFVVEQLIALVMSLGRDWLSPPRSTWTEPVWIGMKAFVLLMAIVGLGGTAPELIYKQF